MTKPANWPRAVSALGAALLLGACAGNNKQLPDTKGASMVTPEGRATNVPPPPNVDRTKCDKEGKQVVTVDTDQDGKPDVWKFFAPKQQGSQLVQVMTCKIEDLNHDGKPDLIVSFDDNGAPEREEFDLDFDGNIDLTNYYQNGKRVRSEIDTNFDKRPDVWKYYEGDKVVRIERDRDGDGRVDEWQYYEGGRLDRIGYDTTGSGRADKWDRAPEGAGEDEAGNAIAAAPTTAAAAPAPPPAPEHVAGAGQAPAAKPPAQGGAAAKTPAAPKKK